MELAPYISLARIDNWPKNLLLFFGVGVAYMFSGLSQVPDVMTLVMALASICCASSANYVLNEAIDAKSDAYHPIKKNRAAVKQTLNRTIITAEYVVFILFAMVYAYYANGAIFTIILFYIFCAWCYNIPPVRFKDKAYLDVLIESINYPLRILIGWMCVLPHTYPPSSLFIIFWSIGGFAMSLKRLAEYQLFNNPEEAAKYRKSYHSYNASTLTVSGFVYAAIIIFGMTIVLLKYKIELVLIMPLLIVWLSWYLLMTLRNELCIIYPEKLIKNKIFIALSCATMLAVMGLMKFSIPELNILSEPLHFNKGVQ